MYVGYVGGHTELNIYLYEYVKEIAHILYTYYN